MPSTLARVARVEGGGGPGGDLEQVGAAQLGHRPELVAALLALGACCRSWRPGRAFPGRRRPRPRRRPRRAWAGGGLRSRDGHGAGSGRLGVTSGGVRVARRSVLSSSVRSLTRFESRNSMSEARSASSSWSAPHRLEQRGEESVVDSLVDEVEREHLQAVGEDGQLRNRPIDDLDRANVRGNRRRSGTAWCSRTRRCPARRRVRTRNPARRRRSPRRRSGRRRPRSSPTRAIEERAGELARRRTRWLRLRSEGREPGRSSTQDSIDLPRRGGFERGSRRRFYEALDRRPSSQDA